MSKLQQLAEQKDSIQIAGQGFLCSFEDLYVENGFNVRDIDKSHLVKMRESWIAGATFPPIQVEVKEDGRLKVIDGHHRYYSYKWASASKNFVKKPIAVVEFEGSTVEQIALMITSSEGMPLTILQRASGYYRMFMEDCPIKDIAKAVSEGVPHVEKAIKMYEFVAVNERYEPLVESGIISTAKINKYIKLYGKDAEKVLSREIDINSLDLRAIQKQPSAVNLSDEEYEKELEAYKKGIKDIKAQIAKNSESVTYKAPSAAIKNVATESIHDIGVAIQSAMDKGKTKDHNITITIDAALAQQILGSKMILGNIHSHNMEVKKNREELGLDLYDTSENLPEMIGNNANLEIVDDETVESTIDTDIDRDLSDPALEYDDMNIDPIPDVENESQDYGR